MGGYAFGMSLAELDQLCTWSGRPGRDDLRALPGGPAVMLFVDADGRAVQLLSAQQARRAALSRLVASPPEPPCPDPPATAADAGAVETGAGSEPDGVTRPRPRVDIAAIVRGVRWRAVHSQIEAEWRYYLAARELYPRAYRKMTTFGPAWFLHLHDGDGTVAPAGVPEIRVTEQIWRTAGRFVGPWPSAAAARQALEGLWDLFDLCRYPEQVRRAPRGQRCAYYDMGRCDAPCDGTAPLAAYARRVAEAWAFACGGVEAWMTSAGQRMRAAAQRQAFEQAGQIKQQLAFAARWRAEWAPHVRTDEQMRLLLLVAATRRKAWTPLVFVRGWLAGGPLIPQRRCAAEAAAWVEQRLRDADDQAERTDPLVRMEQTWLLARWLRRDAPGGRVVLALPEGNQTGQLADAIAAGIAHGRQAAGRVAGSG